MTALPKYTAQQQHTGWQARLRLRFRVNDTRTIISERRHHGPLVVQKPFYPEGAPCHVYLLHPPGGVVGGDQLHIDVTTDERAHALITTPAANKLYRSTGDTSVIQQRLHAADNSVLEWLPQETIAFNGCKTVLSTHIELSSSATYIGWECICLGRPASRDLFQHGEVRQRLQLYRNAQLMLNEHVLYKGGAPIMHCNWGLQGRTVFATMLMTPATHATLASVREHVQAELPANYAATLINDILICRYLGHSAEHAKQLFTDAWRVARPLIIQREACVPRIWRT